MWGENMFATIDHTDAPSSAGFNDGFMADGATMDIGGPAQDVDWSQYMLFPGSMAEEHDPAALGDDEALNNI